MIYETKPDPKGIFKFFLDVGPKHDIDDVLDEIKDYLIKNRLTLGSNIYKDIFIDEIANKMFAAICVTTNDKELPNGYTKRDLILSKLKEYSKFHKTI